MRSLGACIARMVGLAVITDIKSFYPSVSNDQVQASLKKILSDSPSEWKVYSEHILKYYSQLLTAGTGGIPIGPASGHVLGHVVLREVDQALTKTYGDRYFRYVDDIVVICHHSEAGKVHADIELQLRAYGFVLNSNKTVVLDSAKWQQSVMRPDVSEEDKF